VSYESTHGSVAGWCSGKARPLANRPYLIFDLRQGSIGEPHGSSSTGMLRGSSNAIMDDLSHRGIMMKDKERERFEDEGSIGKAGLHVHDIGA
jgi:hypothetical protein